MFRRHPRLGAASAAIAAIAAGGLLTAGPAAAKSSPGRYYGGSTSQENPLSFALARNGKAIAEAHVFIDGTCDDGDWLRYSETVTFKREMGRYAQSGEHVLVGGRLSSAKRFGSRGLWTADLGSAIGRITETFNGKLTPRGRASGTFRATVEVVDAAGTVTATCDSGQVTWNARSARGRVYAGATSTDQPVVVEVDRRGGSVRHVRFGWSAPCTPPETGGWLISEHFRGIPLDGGAFSLALPAGFELPDGGHRALQYSLAGRVGRASATGTVSVTVTDTDPAGAPTSTCDSGRVSWTARSG